MEFPEWLKPKWPALTRKVGSSNALDALLVALLGSLALTVVSALINSPLVYIMAGFDFILLISFIYFYHFFAKNDPDRLGPPAHQRSMKLGSLFELPFKK